MSTTTTPYVLRGRTAAELRAEMNRLGPTDAQGRHDAHTDWHVTWSYPFEQANGACSTGLVLVNVAIEFRLPEWVPPTGADAALVARWRSYTAALRGHEQGHARHGVRAANEVLRALGRSGTQPSYPQIDRVANEEGTRILDHYRKLDLDYDHQTRHGATQGAVFR